MQSDILKSQSNNRRCYALKIRTEKEIDEGKRISALFSTLSEEGKTMAMVYLSALRDKEIIDNEKKELQEV